MGFQKSFEDSDGISISDSSSFLFPSARTLSFTIISWFHILIIQKKSLPKILRKLDPESQVP